MKQFDPIFFTPPPTKWDRRMFKGDTDYPAPDPRQFDVMMRQVDLSQQTLNFVQRAYEENKPRQAALDQLQQDIGKSLLTDAETARQRASETYGFYTEKYRPVEEKMITDAMGADSAQNIALARGTAATDVQQALSGAQQANMRSMSRFGLRPNATALASINSELAARGAASQAGAMMTAEQAARDRAIAMRSNVANVGRGYPAQALAFTGSGQGAGQAAMGNQLAVNQQNMATQGQTIAGMGQAGNQLNQASSQWNQLYGNQLQGWGTAQQANASSSAGFGSLVGMLGTAALMMSSKDAKKNKKPVSDEDMLEALRNVDVSKWQYKAGGGSHIGPMAEDMNREFGNGVAPGGQAIDVVSALGVQQAAIRALADRIDQRGGRKAMAGGGAVHGPGTGTSDSIPARLSAGEYVIPARIVRTKGTEFFDRLIEKTDNPQPKQAAIRR